jgi:hypothetical protein
MLMKRPILILATAAAVFAGAPMVFAAAFNPKDVAADPALLLHVDCDALRASSVGQSILAEQEVQDKLAAVGAIFDFDLRKQLHGLTVYTTEEHPKDGALIVYADFDPNRLITLAKGTYGFQGVTNGLVSFGPDGAGAAKGIEGLKSTTNGSHVIYSWLGDNKKGKDGERPRVYGAIMGHRVIFGQNENHLADALDVLDGKAANFSGKKGLPEAAEGESILAEGVMLKFDFDSDDQNAAVFKMSKSVRLKLSEMAGNMTAHVRFEANDADTANNIGNIAQGLLALLKLQKGDADIMKLANAIVIKQDGPAVGLTLSVPSSELIKTIKEGQKKAEEKAQDTNTPPETK